MCVFFFSSRRRHTRCALVTGVQTCALPISKKEREYLNDRLQSANWLVKALHQRATTILKVASEIVRQQDAFFRKGVEHMKPLTLRDIATEIEMHEATVSWVTSNTYMATPRGTLELKSFFTAAIAGADGTAHSACAVRHRIRVLAAADNDRQVLTAPPTAHLLPQTDLHL